MPTFAHGKNVNVFLNEFDFSTYFNSVSASTSVDTAETSAFGTSAKSYIVGHRDGTISLSGMFEATALVGTDVFFATALGSATKNKVIVISRKIQNELFEKIKILPFYKSVVNDVPLNFVKELILKIRESNNENIILTE